MQAAASAHAQDVGIAGPSRSSIQYAQNHQAPGAAAKKPSKPLDKFANYSTAAQLGLMEEEETTPSTFEIDQMIKNKEANIGQWEEVVDEPTGLHTGRGGAPGQDEDEEGEGWKFQHKGKRPVRDLYEDDDFDPGALSKMRKKHKPGVPEDPAFSSEQELKRELDREAWSGKIDLDGGLSPKKKDGLMYQPGGGWVKLEGGPDGLPPVHDEDVKPDPNQIAAGAMETSMPSTGTADAVDTTPQSAVAKEDMKPTLVDGNIKTTEAALDTEPSTGGLFKKRRPPPSSRKK